jgi:hypothetical protein
MISAYNPAVKSPLKFFIYLSSLIEEERMAHEKLEVWTGGGNNIKYQVNDFLKQNGDDIDVIGFQAVDNSAGSGKHSSDGVHVFYLLYRQKRK